QEQAQSHHTTISAHLHCGHLVPIGVKLPTLTRETWCRRGATPDPGRSPSLPPRAPDENTTCCCICATPSQHGATGLTSPGAPTLLPSPTVHCAADRRRPVPGRDGGG